MELLQQITTVLKTVLEAVRQAAALYQPVHAQRRLLNAVCAGKKPNS
jgi:hypothetical protein